MRFCLGIRSKTRRYFFSLPDKEKPVNGKNPVCEFDFNSKPEDSGFGYRGPDFGSKDESFFDSRVWLDSDCEDDYHSVNGEFTPSGGTTPNYQTSTPIKPQLKKLLYVDGFPDAKSEPSATDGKMKLGDLLQETLQGEQLDNEQNVANGKLEINGKTDPLPRSLEGTPYLSGANSVYSSEATPNIDFKHRKERTGKNKQCCFPRLVPSFSFKDRRKQTMSPDH